MLKQNNVISMPDPAIRELLENFGLSENETAVYVSALKLGNALVKDIAREARLNRTTAYNLLLGLRKAGLVSSYHKNQLTYFSASAPATLATVADQRIADQQKLKDQLNGLLPVLNGIYNSHSRSSTVKIYEGIDSLPEVYRTVYKNARYPVQGLEFTNWADMYPMFPQSARDDMIATHVQRDIKTRSLLIENELTKSWYESDKGQSQNKIIRLLPNPGWDFFCNLELCQDRFAIVTYQKNRDAHAIVIESAELSSMIRLMFEALWQTAA